MADFLPSLVGGHSRCGAVQGSIQCRPFRERIHKSLLYNALTSSATMLAIRNTELEHSGA